MKFAFIVILGGDSAAIGVGVHVGRVADGTRNAGKIQ